MVQDGKQMKLYFATWPKQKDPGGALALIKTKVKQILLSYFFITDYPDNWKIK
jgi:hypothetical protein